MKKYTPLIIASSLAVLLAFAMGIRINSQRVHFEKTVKEALKTSEGYDQKFIDMVTRLENELALRASFGYVGKKDPMTGRERLVATRPAPPRIARKKVEKAVVDSNPALQAEIDPVKLTAIIYEDSRKTYTAVVMNGERSFSVEVGDKVAGRKITKITSEHIYMESDGEIFTYRIDGSSSRKNK